MQGGANRPRIPDHLPNGTRHMADQPVIRSDFYVYALYREDGVTPFYIGKGCGRRIVVHERSAHRFTSHKDRIIQNMLASGIEQIPKKKLFDGLTDKEAGRIEVALIAKLGRCPNGPLANLTDGGDGVSNLCPKAKAKQSAANVRNWADPKVREKRLAGMLARIPVHRRKPKKPALPPEEKAALRKLKRFEGAKRAWANPDVRARRSQASSRVQSTPGAREKRSAIAAENWQKPEVRAKLISARKAFLATKQVTEEERQTAKDRLNSPESLEKRRVTNLFEDVKFRRYATLRKTLAKPEVRAKRSAASKAMWAAKRLEKVQKLVPSENEQASHEPQPSPHPPPP
jgi:hypothetical protein